MAVIAVAIFPVQWFEVWRFARDGRTISCKVVSLSSPLGRADLTGEQAGSANGKVVRLWWCRAVVANRGGRTTGVVRTTWRVADWSTRCLDPDRIESGQYFYFRLFNLSLLCENSASFCVSLKSTARVARIALSCLSAAGENVHTVPISFSLVVQSSRWTGSFGDYCSNTSCIWVCDCVSTYVHAKSFDRMPVWKIIRDADGTFNKWPYGEVNDFRHCRTAERQTSSSGSSVFMVIFNRYFITIWFSSLWRIAVHLKINNRGERLLKTEHWYS